MQLIETPEGYFYVAVNLKDGFSAKEEEKYVTATKMHEELLNSRDFMERFLRLDMIQKENLSNHDIYRMLRSGSDRLNKDADGDMDVSVVIYHANNSTVGYTYPNSVKTWVNRKFFSSYDYAAIAGNQSHEYFHKMGFGHPARETPTRHKTVPYAGGYLVRDMIREMVAGKLKLTPLKYVKPVENKPTAPVSTSTEEPEKRLVCQRSWRTLWLRKVCRYAA